jgi:hypothetical protein
MKEAQMDDSSPETPMTDINTLAEQSIAQAKSTFDAVMAATHRAVCTVEGNSTAAQATARELHDKAMSYAERNVAASFDFAQQLLRAKDTEEIMRLQAEFMSLQLQALAEQARDLAQRSMQVAA